MAKRLEEYNVSPSRGFITANPLECLPPYFEPWETIAQNTPRLIAEGILRTVIRKLPLLDHSKLTGLKELNRAHLVLCILSHGYVWCEGNEHAAKVLPKCLAVPWVGVSKILDLPPILIHNSYVLSNWRHIDQARPLSIDNIEPLLTWTGIPTELGFIKLHLLVELAFGSGAQLVLNGMEAVADDDPAGVKAALEGLQLIIQNMKNSFLHVYGLCDPSDFYNIIRPYLAGWLNNPVMPEGLIYEGVSETPLKYFGGSAAESPIFPLLDAALGVAHYENSGDRTLKSNRYLEKVVGYIAPQTRKFIETVQNGPSMREYVQGKQDEEVLLAYNNCVEELKKFRSLHIRVAAMFVTIQSNKHSETREKAKLGQHGTAASGVMPFLKTVRDETASSILDIDVDKGRGDDGTL